MKLESFWVSRGFEGKYTGRAKIYVGDLIVEVELTSDEAESFFDKDLYLFQAAHERAKAVVRGSYKAAA